MFRRGPSPSDPSSPDLSDPPLEADNFRFASPQQIRRVSSRQLNAETLGVCGHDLIYAR